MKCSCRVCEKQLQRVQIYCKHCDTYERLATVILYTLF